jgi:hypothetical protein
MVCHQAEYQFPARRPLTAHERMLVSFRSRLGARRDRGGAAFLHQPNSMRRVRASFVILGALALPCVTSSAQQPGSVEIGMYGQITRVNPEQARFESGTPLSLGVRGRVNLHRGLGVEMEASTGLVDGVNAPLRRRYNQLVARATYTHPVSDFSGLLLGAGLARSDYEVTYNFGANALVGIRTLIRGRYVLRSDAIFNYLPTSGATEIALRTGVQIGIGPFEGPTPRDRRSGNLTVQEAGTIEGGAFVQRWQLSDVWNLRNGNAFGTRVGAFVTSRSQFEVDATYRRLAVRDGGGAGSTGAALPVGATFRQTTFAFRYNHNVPIGSRFALLAGAGPVRSSYEYVDHWGASGIAGVRVALSRDLQLRADVVGNYLPGASAVDLGVRVGGSALVRLGR